VKKVQQRDTIDVEGIYYLYNKVHSGTAGYTTSQLTLTVTDSSLVENAQELDKLSEEAMRDLIHDFLIAATVKDCSVMLSVCPIPQ
jgi:hypothetical protein